MKLNWRTFLRHLNELVSSKFSRTEMGAQKREGIVEKVEVKENGDIRVFLENGPMYLFPNSRTWAFLAAADRIILKRSGEAPLTTFEFRLRAPFPSPARIKS